MIKASDLRIGNFISDDDGVLAKVIGFAPFDHSVRCDEEEGCQLLVDCYHVNGSRRSGCATDSLECEPIPFTPEWLMTHVAKYEAPYYMLKDRIGLAANYYRDASENYDGFLLCYKIGLEMKSLLDVPVIRYIHQLQNLYFALTGEELQIKMP